MRTVFSILLAGLLSSPIVLGQVQEEEEVSWEEEERAAIRGPRLEPAADQPQAIAPIRLAGQVDEAVSIALPAPQRFPLPEIETSAWALAFPGACLALVAASVSWRRKRRSPGSVRGESDD